MGKLNELTLCCKCGVYVSVNEHRDSYDSVQQHLWNCGNLEDIDPEVLGKMVEMDTAIEIQFYPLTPVGFYRVWHYDLDAALDEALKCLSKFRKETTYVAQRLET